MAQWRPSGETGVAGTVPLHRSTRCHGCARPDRPSLTQTTAPWPPRPLPVGIQGFKVTVLVETREVGVGHAQFLTLIDVRGAAVHVRHQAKCLGQNGQDLRESSPSETARLIVIAGEQAGPSCVLHGSLVTGL